MTNDILLLKEVLSVPTVTYQEDLMVEFLQNWLTENNIEHYVDEHKNVYATKKEFPDLDNYFIWVCAVDYVMYDEMKIERDTDAGKDIYDILYVYFCNKYSYF